MAVVVNDISLNGIWLLFDEKEYFLSFHDFPWFKDATVHQIHNVQVEGNNSLYWPELDIDLSLPTIQNTEKFTLVSK